MFSLVLFYLDLCRTSTEQHLFFVLDTAFTSMCEAFDTSNLNENYSKLAFLLCF